MDTTIPALVTKTAARFGSHVAIVSRDRRLDYRSLDELSDRVAHGLRSRGIGRADLVAVLGLPSVDSAVALLGVMKSGSPYLPLDASHPTDRISRLIELARPAVVVVADGSPPDGPCAVALGQLLRDRPAASVVPPPRGCDLAYVMFTSGSTGQPKGVLTSHRACLARIDGFRRLHPAGPGRRTFLKTSLGFVDSVREIFAPLIQGGSVGVPDPATLHDPAALLREMELLGATRVIVVPSLLDTLLEVDDVSGASLSSIPLWIVTGEAAPPAVVARFRARCPRSRLLNMYGTTEAPGTLADLSPRDAPLSIGYPMPWVRTRVVDADGRAVPLGERGELWLGGYGVADGYLDNPESTAQHFGRQAGMEPPVVFRTGDLVSGDDRGRLYWHGRIDHQVEVRGHRVDPAEVEAALCALPGVRAAVVTLARDGKVTTLRAAVVPTGPGAPSEPALRQALAKALPAYMVPTRIVTTNELPKLPGGKVDRTAVAALTSGERVTRALTTASHGVETAALLASFRSVLPHVDIDDDIISAGADSLVASTIAAAVTRSFGRHVTTGDVLMARTPRALARRLPMLQTMSGRLGGAATSGSSVPLTPVQRAIWLEWALAPERTHYHVIHAARLDGEVSGARLELALRMVAQLHPALRTMFPWHDEAPAQIVGAVQVDLHQERCATPDLLLTAATEFANLPFDLEKAPPTRFGLFTAGGCSVFVACFHHIVADDRSVDLFVDALSHCYRAAVDGRPIPLDLAAPSDTYAHYARWQQSREEVPCTDDLSYWRGRLGPVLQGGWPGTAHGLVGTGVAAHRGFVVPVSVTQALRCRAVQAGVTLHTVVMAAYVEALSALTSMADVIVNIPVTDRPQAEFANLIGCCVGLLPTVLSAAAVGDSGLRHLYHELAEAMSHASVPLDRIVDALPGGHSRATRRRLGWAAFGMRSGPHEIRLPGVRSREVPVLPRHTAFALDTSVVHDRGELNVRVTADGSLLASDFHDALTERFGQALEEAAQAPTANSSGRGR